MIRADLTKTPQKFGAPEMGRVLFLLFITFIIPPSVQAKNYGDITVSEVTIIYDGDTFRVNISDYPPIVGERIPVRIDGVDAPEIRGKCKTEIVAARKAKQYTVQALRTAKVVQLRNIKRGKYFRILAEVYVDGKSLAQELISSGNARPYHGGKRRGWCN